MGRNVKEVSIVVGASTALCNRCVRALEEYVRCCMDHVCEPMGTFRCSWFHTDGRRRKTKQGASLQLQDQPTGSLCDKRRIAHAARNMDRGTPQHPYQDNPVSTETVTNNMHRHLQRAPLVRDNSHSSILLLTSWGQSAFCCHNRESCRRNQTSPPKERWKCRKARWQQRQHPCSFSLAQFPELLRTLQLYHLGCGIRSAPGNPPMAAPSRWGWQLLSGTTWCMRCSRSSRRRMQSQRSCCRILLDSRCSALPPFCSEALHRR